MLADHNEIYERFLGEIDASYVEKKNATAFWLERCKQIKDDAHNGSKYDFLRWPSLNAFSVPEAWIPLEIYNALKRDEEWNRRWFALTRETKIGGPKDFSHDFGTSPILVQHVYHLMRYEAATSRSLLDCDAIFEIGGGYGSFCRLLKNAGFKGVHMIYDLPAIASVQRLYLSMSGFTEVPWEHILQPDSRGGFCLIADEQLDAAYYLLISKSINVAFVATWSLSEAPMTVRKKIFPRFHRISTRYLIAFNRYGRVSATPITSTLWCVRVPS